MITHNVSFVIAIIVPSVIFAPFCYITKPFIIEIIIKFQPSAKTNSKILNGIEIVVGGSIIIPIDIKVDATTISITINGI